MFHTITWFREDADSHWKRLEVAIDSDSRITGVHIDGQPVELAPVQTTQKLLLENLDVPTAYK